MSPKIVDTGQSYQALWWVARTTTIACIVLFLTNLSTGAIIFALMPLKEIKPMLFTTQSKSEQVVRIEPLEKDTKGLAILMEALAREYVALRETFDFQTEKLRWQRLYAFSSTELGDSFNQQMGKQGTNSPYEQFKQRGMTRSVQIISSASLAPSAPNIWQVDWESIDRDNKSGHETRGYWVSTLTADCEERAVTLEDQYVNPIGFTVKHYTVANKQPPTRSAS